MSKIHYFQRYSSVENTVTNNTLQLFTRIYDYSTSQASKLLSDIIDEPIEIGLEVNQQEKASDSVPDGSIIQRSFKILIESKVGSAVNEDQLIRHAKVFSSEAQKILLLLTVKKADPAQLERISAALAENYENVVFQNVTFEDICNCLQGLFKAYEDDMQALVEDYIEYCNDTGLFDQSRFLMRVVPCGASLSLNRKYAIYFQPIDRGYTRHSFVGIYTRKRVHCLWAIDAAFDVEYDGSALRKKLVQGRKTNEHDQKIIEMIADAKQVCGWDVRRGHRFFCGKGARDTDFRKTNPGGVMGTRLINVRDVVGEFENDRDLASKLADKTWE